MKIVPSQILRRKKTILILFPVIIITLLLLNFQLRSGAAYVTTYTAQRGDFIVDIEERGDLDATSKIMLSVPDNVYNSIRITRLVPDGSMVKKGDFLVQFDASAAEERVANREDELANAKAEFSSTIARIESNMKELESDYMTQKYSYEQVKIRFETMKYEAEAKRQEGELNLKKAELALKQAEALIESQKIIDQANIAKAEVRVKQAEMRYKEAVDQLNALTIIAPKDGVVVLQEEYNRSTGKREKIKVGDSPHRRMPLVSIPELSKMIVKTKVNEVAIRKVKTGQNVRITLDAIPEVTYSGVISNVATLAHREEGSERKVFDIEVTMENTDERIKPGMTAQCSIITEKISNQLFIPLDCVFEKEDTTVVYVKGDGFKQRFVKVGKRNNDFIVIQDGLKEGEKVALRDPTLLMKGGGTKEMANANGAK